MSQQTPVHLCQFQELEYELRRQAGSAYVGQRLAKGTSQQGNVELDETQDGVSPHRLASNTTTQDTLQVIQHGEIAE